MRKSRDISARGDERGIVILLVAVVLLFVVGAMAALSIDVVTFYTARSEAQMAADSAALAAARVLANSGLTSNGSPVTAEPLATTIADQVAARNPVGGRSLVPAKGEVVVTFNDTDPSFSTNPRVTVQTKRADLPTFFARIWGSAAVTVQATATAEVYNPSGASALGGPLVPVAPTCVKPMVLPNLSPGGGNIINATTGAITNPGLVGQNISATLLQPVCAVGQCKNSTWFPGTPTAWQFYSGDQSSFPAPATGLPSCAGGLNAYEQSVAGCVQTPIACGSVVNLETTHQNLHQQTASAVNCLTHAKNSAGDSVDQTSLPPNAPYQFLTGGDNPLVVAGSVPQGTDVSVSDSIVTVPIYDTAFPPTLASPSVTVVGFVQLFLNQDGNSAGNPGVTTQVINIAGCPAKAVGQAILGNGSSPVPVRLVTPP